MTVTREADFTDLARERAVLVGVKLKSERGGWAVEDSLAELAQLARTAGLQVGGQVFQRPDTINPATYIGKGKAEEVGILKVELDCDLVIFDDELSPRQQRELEEAWDTKVLDRTSLILDIFAQHAHTREGQLQVELAQYEYRLPRLTRMWTHLARQAGGGAARGGAGGVGLRGPGERQLEVDRRRIRERISQLKQELEQVRTHRRLYRRQRRDVSGAHVLRQRALHRLTNHRLGKPGDHHVTSSIRAIDRRAFSATGSGTSTSCCMSSNDHSTFSSVIRFMFGHVVRGPTSMNVFSGLSFLRR